MIEGKNIVSKLVYHGVDICNIPVLQICGSELHMGGDPGYVCA
jgi:hypothetical protein